MRNVCYKDYISDLSFLFQVALCKPNGIYICDGSDAEGEEIKEKMVARGMLTKLDKYDNW